MVVEAVGAMAVIPQAALQPPPALGSSGALRFVEGLAPWQDQMAQVLDIEALTGGEMTVALTSA
jgi:chemotaxis signal transduction protein